MTARDFVYWLKGYFEISSQELLSDPQTQLIREKLFSVSLDNEIEVAYATPQHDWAYPEANTGTNPLENMPYSVSEEPESK